MRFEQIVFAIDANDDLHSVAKFMRLMDTKRVMGELKGTVVQCIGAWTDDDGHTHLEPSYMVDARDYYEVVKPSGYVDGQVCVLAVPGDTRQPCALIYANGYREGLKPMRKLKSILGVPSWTYVIATGDYFSC